MFYQWQFDKFSFLSITFRLMLMLALLSVSLVVMPVPKVYAATTRTINVDNVPDSDTSTTKCTLREAIEAANDGDGAGTNAAGCTITESGSGTPVSYVLNLPSYTYTIETGGSHEEYNADGDLDIKNNVTINGAGVGNTILDGNGAERIFDIDPIEIGAGRGNFTVRISNMTLQNGREMAGMGGCVSDVAAADDGDTTYLTNVTFSNCRARNGGAVRVRNSTMYISNSTLTDSQANISSSIGGDGGAIIVEYGTMTISNSTISNSLAQGHGGAIYNQDSLTVGSAVYIVNSTITGNRSTSDGGGILNAWSGGGVTLNIGNSTISNNTVEGGWGGGIANGFGCVATITQTAVYSNAVDGGGGGGFYNVGTLNIVNSTISTNKATAGGGGVNNEGTVNLSFVTVTNNVADSDNASGGDGGGIYRAAGTFTIKNSIIGINTDLSGGAPDCSGSINVEGYNLLYDNLGCVVGGGGAYSVAVDPKLDTWQDNGGSTYTHALLDGSPAIDAAPTCTDLASNTLDTDQRGTSFSRPVDADEDGVAECDLGAYEIQSGKVYLPIILLSL